MKELSKQLLHSLNGCIQMALCGIQMAFELRIFAVVEQVRAVVSEALSHLNSVINSLGDRLARWTHLVKAVALVGDFLWNRRDVELPCGLHRAPCVVGFRNLVTVCLKLLDSSKQLGSKTYSDAVLVCCTQLRIVAAQIHSLVPLPDSKPNSHCESCDRANGLNPGSPYLRFPPGPFEIKTVAVHVSPQYEWAIMNRGRSSGNKTKAQLVGLDAIRDIGRIACLRTHVMLDEVRRVLEHGRAEQEGAMILRKNQREPVLAAPAVQGNLERKAVGLDSRVMLAGLLHCELVLTVDAVAGCARPVFHHLLGCIYCMAYSGQRFWRCGGVLQVCASGSERCCEVDKWSANGVVELVDHGCIVVGYAVQLLQTANGTASSIKIVDPAHSDGHIDCQEERDHCANDLNPSGPFGLAKAWPVGGQKTIPRVHVHSSRIEVPA